MINMSMRPPSQKSACFSLQSGLFRNDPSSNMNQEYSSDESEYDSIAYHRPKCPWGRRRSYIQKVKKTAFFENSVTCVTGSSQSSSKKPWLISSVTKKKNDSWQRPLGKKKAGVQCFCSRKEQAKITPPSQKVCPPEWIESRRNHIVSKFDGFSKNILKITGKLSQETISMITAKIKENLESSDFNVQKLYTSPVKLTRNNPYPSTTATNRFPSRNSQKILPDLSCVKVSETNIFTENNYTFCDKTVSVDKKSVLNNPDALTVQAIDTNNVKSKAVSDQKEMISNNISSNTEKKVSSIDEKDPPGNVNNNFDSESDYKNCISENSCIVISESDHNELFTPSDDTLRLARNMNSLHCNTNSSTGNLISSVDKATSRNQDKRLSSVNKTTRSIDRAKNCRNVTLVESPASLSKDSSQLTERPDFVEDKSIVVNEKAKPRGDKICYNVRRPSSREEKYLCVRERTVSFGENSYIGDETSTIERPDSVNMKTLSSRDRPTSKSKRESKLTEKPVSFVKKSSHFVEGHKYVKEQSLTVKEKPKSRSDKTHYSHHRPLSDGNKNLRRENTHMSNNPSIFDRLTSTRDMTSQNPWARHKPSQFYARSMSIRNNSNLSEHSSSNNDKLLTAGDKIFEHFKNSIAESKMTNIYETNVSVGGNNCEASIEKPMSSNKTLTPILRPSSKNKSSLIGLDSDASYNEKPASASDNTNQQSLTPERESSTLHEKSVSFGDSTYIGHDSSQIKEKSSSNKKNLKAIEKLMFRNKFSHFHARTFSISDNIVCFDKPLSAGDKWSNVELPDDKALNFTGGPTLASKRKKPDGDLVSKANLIKSSLDIVKSLPPLRDDTFSSAASKVQSPNRKLLLERNAKKRNVQLNCTNYPNGYTVQLVKLKDSHKRNGDLRK